MIALVAGASRGGGRGIALALGDIGATVYVAARTTSGLEQTAEAVTRRGGRGIAITADFSDPEQVSASFRRVEREHGRLDVVAVTAWQADFMAVWSKLFWEMERSYWQDTLATVSTYWYAGAEAARIMTRQGSGLIAFMTDNHWEDPAAYRGNILHDAGHECVNRLVIGMSEQTKPRGVAVVGLNPGFMRTERVLAHMATDELKKQFRFDLSESPEYVGRALAALARDPKVIERSGRFLWGCDLAKEYGFTDIDGRQRLRFDPRAPVEPYPES